MPADERIAVVLGGGGERVIAWELGVLIGAQESGLDFSSAAVVLGTSAGVMPALWLANGDNLEEAAERLLVQPCGRPARYPASAYEALAVMQGLWRRDGSVGDRRRAIGVAALAAPTPPEAWWVEQSRRRVGSSSTWPARLVIAVIEARTGERSLVGAGHGHSVAEGVAAARAVPGVAPPIHLAGTAYVDGGIGSATNADLLADVETVVIVSPTPTHPRPGTIDEAWADALREEIAAHRAAGRSVLCIQPDAEAVDAMGPDLLSAGDPRRALRAGRATVRQHHSTTATCA